MSEENFASDPKPPPFSGPAEPGAEAPLSASGQALSASAAAVLARQARVEQELLEIKRVVIFYFAILAPLLGLLGWIYHTGDQRPRAEYWGAGVLYATIGAFAWSWRDELRGKFVWPKGAPWQVWAVTLLTPFVTVAAAVSFYHWMHAIGFAQGTRSLLDSEAPLWFNYVWIAVLPAFFEETAFRGLILSKLGRLAGPVQAAWITAITFGVAHISVLSLAVFLVPLAMVAAWLTHRSRSLWPAMILHFLHNAAVITVERWL